MRLSFLFALFVAGAAPAVQAGDDSRPSTVARAVDDTMRPLMQAHGIPGMAVAVTVRGRDYFRHYGVASRESGRPVDAGTLFEIGSVSKLFTATLAAHAEAEGRLSLSERATESLPALRGTALDKVTLLQLATYTGGGLPLQVPDGISDARTLQDYFRTWQPAHPPGTRRVYSNLGIGLLGAATAARLGQPFEQAVERTVFAPLGMGSSYYRVPAARMKDYAQGYTKADAPVRMQPGMYAGPAYGVRATAADMLRFLAAGMPDAPTAGALRKAMARTRQAQFRAGDMVQGLVWEQYSYPVGLQQLLSGNGDRMVYQPVEAVALAQAWPPAAGEVLLNKTGSTNGFAAYVAVVPARGLGIVMLANKNYPAAARIAAALEVLTKVEAALP